MPLLRILSLSRPGASQIISRQSAPAAGSPADPGGSRPEVTADGKYLVFESDGPLVHDDTNGAFDIYRRNLSTGEIARISEDKNGAQANSFSLGPSVSLDGRRVAFRSLSRTSYPTTRTASPISL